MALQTLETPMHQRGKLVIVFMFLLALGLSAYAWWHQYNENPRSKAFWVQHANLTIRRSKSVEFLDLTPVPDSQSPITNESIAVGGKKYSVTGRDIRNSPGLIHARHALINDNSFEWNGESPTSCEPHWEFGLRFGEAPDIVTIVFDTSCDRILWIEAAKSAQLVPLSAKAFRKKRADWEKVGGK